MTILFMIFVLVGCFKSGMEKQLFRYEFSQRMMGVQVRMLLYAKNESDARDAAQKAFERIATIESAISDYQRNSELNRLLISAIRKPEPISEDLYRVLERSLYFYKISEGAFDITLAPVIQLWREARKTHIFPDSLQLQETLKNKGADAIRLTAQQVYLEKTLQIDFGGIGKGYAGDEALKVLYQHDIRQAMIEFGGELVIGEAPPHSKGWKIAIPNDSTSAYHYLSNTAVSTSGDTVQFVAFEGRRYSHIVNPFTGLGLTSGVSVTVVANSGMDADALSTTFSVMPLAHQNQFIEAYFPNIKVFRRVQEF